MKPIAISMGEPAGIGPDLALMAWLRRGELPAFCVFADPALLRDRAARMGFDVPIIEATEADAAAAFGRGLPVIPLEAGALVDPGQPDVAAAASVIEAIERSVASVHRGASRAVVTAPIMKDILYKAGFRHPGHTEFLGELSQRLWGIAVSPVMLIWSPIVAVVPVTIHIPLSAVPAALTEALVFDTGMIVAEDMRRRFGIAQPRLAVSGLNPHAGENGALGREDAAVIAPAIQRLQEAGVTAWGPLPADTMFHARARAAYDVALCMYHDQALAPAKALAFDEAVNVTLGLPFVRTSPDHGTAFDIAATGRADPSSFMASIRLADRLAG